MLLPSVSRALSSRRDMAASITFFMTVGKASPEIRPSRRPAMAGGRGTVADLGAIDIELEREMREDVRDAAGALPVGGERRASALVSPSMRAVQPVVGTSRHAAEQALVGRACAEGSRHRPRRRRRPRRAAAASPPFAAVPAEARDRRPAMARQSSRSGQSMQRGRFGVQIVAPRSIIACAKSPGRSAGTSVSSVARISGLASGSGVSDLEEPRHHALDIAVDHRRRPVEGDRRDRRRRVGADAGQLAQAVLGVGKRAAGQRGDDARRISSDCGRGNNSRARPRPS